jgi:ferredoxin
MVDDGDRLQKVIVDERFIREAVRCRALWRSLQELGGIHNSHVAKALAQAKAEAKAEAPASQPESAPVAPAAAAPASAAPAAAAPEPEKERAPDEPYIETPRCSSCNECTQINSKMFAYDENKQARIVDATAGTYKQLVEAAESCQVAIIHPGKPKNPNEPGLEELLQRAEAFQ